MKLEKILSIPKSFWVSFHFFSLKEAIKLPILVRYNAQIKSLQGKIEVQKESFQTALFQIGFGEVGIYDKKYSRSIIEQSITFGENVRLAHLCNPPIFQNLITRQPTYERKS